MVKLANFLHMIIGMYIVVFFADCHGLKKLIVGAVAGLSSCREEECAKEGGEEK